MDPSTTSVKEGDWTNLAGTGAFSRQAESLDSGWVMGSIGPRLGQVPFQAHIELLHLFLARRDDIVERIQGLLNAQRKPIEYLQDGSLLSRHCEDCFFTLTGVTHSQSRLRGQLDEAHWAGGFRPREIRGLHNGLVDPAEMMMRAFYLWRQTRWPGRNGRVRYAHTLFNVYVIQRLELLSLRLWDAPRLAPLARGQPFAGIGLRAGHPSQ